MSSEILTLDLKGLKENLERWQELVLNVSEVNPFYEPWMLIPALENLKLEGSDVVKVFVVLGTSGRWDGLFPVHWKKTGFRARLASMLGFSGPLLWLHRHCYLTTPLVRKGKELATLESFLSFSRARSNLRRMDWFWMSGEGPVWEALQSVLAKTKHVQRAAFFNRATCARLDDVEAHLKEIISGKHRRDLNRLENRLSENGGVLEYQLLAEDAPSSEVSQWVNAFLDTEASGWKGEQGTALKCNASDRQFFEQVIQAAHSSGKLLFFRSRIGEIPLAFKCQFLSQGQAFSFKIAYNDLHKKFRPGLLLELKSFSLSPWSKIESVDSCAEAGHPMLERVFSGRKKIANLSFALSRFPQGAFLYAHDELRLLKRRFKPAPIAAALPEKALSSNS
jgi:CelD/BcsL family acetyltransferase involved in cellulose biosynthesis